MINCPDCGTRNGLNALLCTNCGAELPLPTPPVPEPEQVDAAEDTSSMAPVITIPPEALLAEAADRLADGHPDAAADLCQQAIEADPDRAPAYALLGMAEEERGDLAAAIEAYVRAQELDPSRTGDTVRVEELQARLDEEALYSDVAEERSLRRLDVLNRYAPVLFAGAFGLLIMTIGIVWVLKAQHARFVAATEGEYTRYMNDGKEWVARGEYDNAAQCFQAALGVRPDDQDATLWVNFAQNTQRTAADYDRLTHDTAGGKWLGTGSGQNPFAPTPIGQPSPQFAGQYIEPVPPPMIGDVTGRDRSGGGGSSSVARAPVFDDPFAPPTSPAPAGDYGTGAAGTPTPGPAVTPPAPVPGPTGATQTPEPPTRRSQITITRSEAPAPVAAAAPQQDPGEPDRLRRQGDELRRAGKGQEAAQAYHQAIQKYKENPGNPTVSQHAVESMQKALGVIEGSGH